MGCKGVPFWGREITCVVVYDGALIAICVPYLYGDDGSV